MLRSRALSGVEVLENKRLLACDVTFDGESLKIECDDAGDIIIVREEGGDLVVGLNNLGSAEDLTDVVIKSGGGNDAIIFQGLAVSENLKVESGDGTDVVNMVDSVIGGDLKISTGADDDNVFFQNDTVVGGDAKVETGDGNDRVFALFGSLTAAEDIKIDGGDGTDEIVGLAKITAGGKLKVKDVEITT